MWFEIWTPMGRIWWNLGGRNFLYLPKEREISGRISGQISEQISEKFSETSFQSSWLFFGNFVQQKGGAKEIPQKVRPGPPVREGFSGPK